MGAAVGACDQAVNATYGRSVSAPIHMNEAPRLAVICHDAGGAEILSSYVRLHAPRAMFVLEGPAREIFDRKLGPVETVSLDQAIHDASSVLSGTGWQSDFEWRAIGLARKAGKHTIAFLDHWINYRKRFERRGVQHLPDEIWVGDAYAARIAQAELADVPIKVVENPYIDDVRRRLQALGSLARPHPDHPVALYVCEPMREIGLRQHGDERYFGYVEEEALAFFLDHLDSIAPHIERIILRRHPAEPVDKYLWAAERRNGLVQFSSGTSLEEDVAGADIVVGLESMAMIVGLIAHKRVLTAIPPGGRPCQLPHEGIESLQVLVTSGSH
jgi:hypothetical protein